MAQTISHEAKAPVKKNPGKAAPARDWSQLSQDEVKAALLLLLNRTKEQLSDLQDEFDIIDTLIDPDPQPLPDTINPNTLFAKLSLVEEREAVHKAAEALGRDVETFRAAVKDMAGGSLRAATPAHGASSLRSSARGRTSTSRPSTPPSARSCPMPGHSRHS